MVDNQEWSSMPIDASDGQIDSNQNSSQNNARNQGRKTCLQRTPVIGFLLDLYGKYDSTFLTMLGMQYFNQGQKILVILAAQDLFKAYYKLEPGHVQSLMAWIAFPWSIKVIYGLMSDNFPICGSRRKSYILIAASIQFFSMLHLFLFSQESVSMATTALFMTNLSVALSDVIVDSLMIIQSRKDPESGSQELVSFSWVCFSIGGLTGSTIAAFLTESYEPKYCFLYSSVMGFIIAFVASRLSVAIEYEETDGPPQDEQRTFWQDVRRNMREMKQACQVREFRNVILYLIVGALVVPSFGSFGYYFLLDVVEISKFTYSMLTVVGFFGLLLGSMAFNRFFKDSEYKRLIIVDALISIFMAPFQFIFVLRWNLDLGIPDLALCIFLDVVADIVTQCFIFLPMSVIFTKITPKHIEATSFALLAGVSNFRGTARGWIGASINEMFVGVTQKDLSKYWQLVAIGFFCSFIPLFFLFLIPTKEEVNKLQGQVQNNATVGAKQVEGKDSTNKTLDDVEMTELS